MKTWVWVLLLVAVVLFLWTVRREGFQSTATLKGPPYGDTDYVEIVRMMSPALVTALKTKNNAGAEPTMPTFPPSPADTARYQADLAVYQKKLVDGVISDTMGEFYTTIYQPATAALTTLQVDTFMTTYMEQIKTTSPTNYAFLNTNKADVSAFLVLYFVKQPAGAANVALTAAQTASAGYSATSGYDAVLTALGQTSSKRTQCSDEVATKQWDEVSEECKKFMANTPSDPSSISTGGSSLLVGSNAGGTAGPAGVQKGNIWGPAFTGLGDNAGDGMGGSGSRDYPTLLGPKPKESVMVEGAGLSRPSIHLELAKPGGLPSSGSTGSNEDSRFFGTSRLPESVVPGDQDLYPSAFTPSTGSSKTEPIPFLSDFSAFLR